MAGHSRDRSTQAEIARSNKIHEHTDLTNVPAADVDRDALRKATRETAAKLYGAGYSRPKIARILRKHLITDFMKTRPMEQQLMSARNVLKRWEKQDSFRDLIYSLAIIKIDLATPQIVDGVIKKAKRGRVDAARFALELSGRHNPRAEQQPAQVVVQIAHVPRPCRVKEGNQVVTLEASEFEELDP